MYVSVQNALPADAEIVVLVGSLLEETTPAIIEFHPKQLWLRGSKNVSWDVS